MLLAALVIVVAIHAAQPACGPLMIPDFAELSKSTLGIHCRY